MLGLSYFKLSKPVYLATFAAFMVKVVLVSNFQIIISLKDLQMSGVS